MSWYAADELENAWSETRDLLFPLDTGTWARLFLIVILTGNGFSMPNMPSSFPSNTGTSQGSYSDTYGTATTTDTTFSSVTDTVPEFSMTGLATASDSVQSAGIAVLAILILALMLAFMLVSSVFEFIYYQSLLDKDVSIRENWSKHWKKGARYLGFRLGVLLVFILAVIGIVAGFMTGPLVGGLLVFGAMLGLLPVMVFLGLTQNFVLLKMMETGEGVIESWRAFWPELRNEWKQVAVYVFARFAVKVVFGIATLVWALVTLLMLAVPFGIVAALFYMVTPVLAAVPVAIGLVVWLVLILGLAVVTQTFLYNYAILVYHDLTA